MDASPSGGAAQELHNSVVAPPTSQGEAATEPSHENVSQSQDHDEGMDDSHDGVQIGQHYPMSLNVSPSLPGLDKLYSHLMR
jgi:hypothetical protein